MHVKSQARLSTVKKTYKINEIWRNAKKSKLLLSKLTSTNRKNIWSKTKSNNLYKNNTRTGHRQNEQTINQSARTLTRHSGLSGLRQQMLHFTAAQSRPPPQRKNVWVFLEFCLQDSEDIQCTAYRQTSTDSFKARTIAFVQCFLAIVTVSQWCPQKEAGWPEPGGQKTERITVLFFGGFFKPPITWEGAKKFFVYCIFISWYRNISPLVLSNKI